MECCKTGEVGEVEHMIMQLRINRREHVLADRVNADPDTLYINRPSPQGLTAFHLACSFGHLEIAKLLHQNGARINARDFEGYTPIHGVIAEVPSIEAPKSPGGAIQEKFDHEMKRKRFLDMLKWLLSLPEINLKAITYEGESVIDLISEDDNGMIDPEVTNLMEQALSSRGIDKNTLGEDDDEEDEEEEVPEPVVPDPEPVQPKETDKTSLLGSIVNDVHLNDVSKQMISGFNVITQAISNAVTTGKTGESKSDSVPARRASLQTAQQPTINAPTQQPTVQKPIEMTNVVAKSSALSEEESSAPTMTINTSTEKLVIKDVSSPVGILKTPKVAPRRRRYPWFCSCMQRTDD
jgi:hypothetical protein